MSESDRWYFGPSEAPRRYWTDDVSPLASGDGLVVRAVLDDPAGQVQVAVKVTPVVSDRLEIVQERLAVVATIRHPNLAAQVESFVGPPLRRHLSDDVDGDPVFYVVSEWTEGDSLRERGPMSVDQMLDMIEGVANGVEELHRSRLVHRDLHPGNVIVQSSGTGVVIDYGTVRSEDGIATETLSGVIGFIAPNAVSGGTSKADDRWSVGMLAVFALLGRPQGRTPLDELRAELTDVVGRDRRSRGIIDDVIAMVNPAEKFRPVSLQAWVASMRSPAVRRPWAKALVVGGAAVGFGLAGTVFVTGADGQNDSQTIESSIAVSLPPPIESSSANSAPTTESTTTSAAPTTSEPPPTPTPDCFTRTDLTDPQDFGAPASTCWSEETGVLHDIDYQFVLSETGTTSGVTLTRPDGGSLYLPLAAWLSYKEIAGRSNPDNAPVFGGYPTSISYLKDPDAVAVELDGGGVLIGPRDDSQFFWVHPGARGLWEELGGRDGDLGFPASNVRVTTDGAMLEFEHGFLTATPENVAEFQAGGEIPIEVTLVDDRVGPYGDVPPTSGLISQWNGVAWAVENGQRRWIQDGDTWTCLGGQDALAVNDLPGWAVWIYPIGPAATCPDDQGA